jgi:hypothetical protein
MSFQLIDPQIVSSRETKHSAFQSRFTRWRRVGHSYTKFSGVFAVAARRHQRVGIALANPLHELISIRPDNCQVAVFTNYSSAKGHTFIDRRLFLPEEWADDEDRRSDAGVEAGVIFRTKPELALEMTANAIGEHVPFR